MLPVGMGQHEVVQQVVEGLARDRHTQAIEVREIRSTEPARFMDLGEVDFLGRTVLCLPDPYPPLQCPSYRIRIGAGIGPLQPTQERHGLQARLLLEHPFKLRPHCRQRVQPGPPSAGRPPFAG